MDAHELFALIGESLSGRYFLIFATQCRPEPLGFPDPPESFPDEPI
jgi:hypothetical protein